MKSNLDSTLGISFKNVAWETELVVLSLSFFSYEMRIVVLVTVNIKCVTLRYEYMFEICCRRFEQKRDASRIRLKRTLWAASREPIFWKPE